MGFVEKKDVENCGADSEVEDSDEVVCITKNMSTSSLCVTEEDDEEEVQGEIQIGPRRTLKEQYEADKDDESLMRWKAQLLGAVDINSVAETLDPEAKILSLAIVSPGREDLLLPIPDSGKVKGTWFTLKEGSRYAIKFTFQVRNNIVSGLKYINTVWKTGLKVDKTKEMIGTFSPQQELYTHEIPEDTTPSGIFARGSYSAKTKVPPIKFQFFLSSFVLLGGSRNTPAVVELEKNKGVSQFLFLPKRSPLRIRGPLGACAGFTANVTSELVLLFHSLVGFPHDLQREFI